ncbi:retinol dehydrogenase 7-like [Argonauta hians]
MIQEILLITLPFFAFYIIRRFLEIFPVGGYKDKYVLITGCDRGFGNILAKKLDGLGFNVFACCLTKDGVSELSTSCTKQCEPLLMDVTKKEDIKKAEKFVRSKLPDNTGLWAVVNNAGVLGTMIFADFYTRENYDEVMNVNAYGTIDVTNAFLPLLRMAKGRLVNVSSIFGKMTSDLFIPYCMSKYAVEAYSNGLRATLLHQNVSVHIIQPGGFNTDLISIETITKRTYAQFESAPAEVQQYYSKKSVDAIVDRLAGIRLYNTNLNEVISCHVHAITAKYPKYRYTPGFDAKYIVPILRILPIWVSDRILTLGRLPLPGMKLTKTE